MCKIYICAGGARGDAMGIGSTVQSAFEDYRDNSGDNEDDADMCMFYEANPVEVGITKSVTTVQLQKSK